MDYYGDNETSACAWLRELVAGGHLPDGVVVEKDIKQIDAFELLPHDRVHLFAGIGGWAHALDLAGWPRTRPVWTGSCPCQPFSAAGKRKGQADERDLWPAMLRLIKECRPETVFGEQVSSAEVVGTELEAAFLVAVQTRQFARANKIAKRLVSSRSFHFHQRWLTRIRTDLGAAGYSVWWKVLGAHSVGAPHIRQRLFWVANTTGTREVPTQQRRQRRGIKQGSNARRLADSNGRQPGDGRVQRGGEQRQQPQDGGTADGVEHATGDGREQGRAEPDWWSTAGRCRIDCADGKARRIEPAIFPLAHGIPGRVGLLRGAGNAIVPETAAKFIRAFLDTERELAA